MSELNDLDRAILNRIQSDFPLTSRPYMSIADEVGISEDDILKRLARLKEKGGVLQRSRVLSNYCRRYFPTVYSTG